MANISLAVWLMALTALGCSNQVVTQAAGDGGADGRDVEIGGAAGGRAMATGGKVSTGGAVAAAGTASLVGTGGVAATANGGMAAAAGAAGSIVVTIKACLVSVSSDCLCTGAWKTSDTAGYLAMCKDALECWKLHNCGPNDSCSARNATAPCSEYNYDSATWDMAKTTYACACQ